MKKIVTIMIIAVLAVTSVFAAKAVSPTDYTFGGRAGWVRISGEDAVTFNVSLARDFIEGNDFSVGVEGDAGLAIFTTEGARFTQYIGPTFTFKGVLADTDIVSSVGAKFVEYIDFFDVGVSADLHTVFWVAPGCGITFGGELTRLLKSHSNSYGAYLGLSCQL